MAKSMTLDSGNGCLNCVLISLAMMATAAMLAPAQSVIWQQTSPFNASYPFALPLTDVNGDGINDIVAWSPDAYNGPVQYAGYIGVFSGADGTVLRETHGTTPNEGIHVVGSVGDVDADGAGDYMIDSLPLIDTIVSGASGSILGTVPWDGANAISGIGDVNGDGFGDFALGVILGSPGPVTGAGFVEVYGGPSGRFLYRTHGQYFHDAFGTKLAPLGDIDQDGVPDFLVGAPGLDPSYLPNYVPGWAHIVSGVDGTIIRTWTGPQIASIFGRELVSPGDMNGDGVPDVLVGAPGEAVRQAYLFSGATGAQLAFFHQSAYVPGGLFASELSAAGDADLDGVPDYAIHTALYGFDVRSGATSNVMLTLSTNQVSYFAYNLGPLDDVDGDGFPDILCASPPLGWSTLGHLTVYSLRPNGLTPFGTGCPTLEGSLPRIGGSSVPRVGQPFTLNLSHAPEDRESYFAAGFSNLVWNAQTLPMDLGGLGASGCSLLVSLDHVECIGTFSRGANGGAATITFQIPFRPGLIGLDIHAQWFVANPQGSPSALASTAGLTVEIGP